MATNGITTLGSRTFLFGGASGIDTSALIKAAYDQRKAEADKIDVQITKNLAKYEAYDKIRTLSNAVSTSLTNIKKNYSVLAGNTGLFDKRTGSLSSTNTSTSLSGLVSVAIDPGTTLGDHEVIINAKGKAHRVASATTTDATAVLGYTGDFAIGVAGKTAATINVTSGMSLTDLASAINANSSTTGVSASIVKVSATEYQMVMTGSDINKQIQITGQTGDNVLQNVGVVDAGGVFVNEMQPATAAQITVDGITYSRDSNTINDVLPGVTFTIKNADPATTMDLTIENDNSSIKGGIQDFIDAYNSLRDFIKSQQVVSEDGDVSSDVVLFGDTIMGNLNLALQGALGGSYGAGGTAFSTLRDLGITLDESNKLVMDETKFDDALINKFDQVRDVFQTQVSSDNTNFRMSKNTSTSGSQSFALQITMSGSSISSVSVGGDTSLFDVSGSTITGKAGTVYEGMTFAYIGTTDATINVNVKAGLSDVFDANITKFSDILNGDISKEMLRISSLNTQLSQRSTRIIERADAFRENLINKYADFESRLARAQTVLAQLRAITGSDKNNN